jgi:hypothetical protein
MSIQKIVAQLEALYGKPTATILWNNNKLFSSDFLPNDALELLFHCGKQCQEVAIIVDTPYMGPQLISNTMLFLLKSRIVPMHEFEDWEAIQNKTWPLLQTFIHGAYAHKLVANNLRNMTGQLSYVQPAHNMYNVLEMDVSSNKATTIAQTAAAATTGSALDSTYQTTPSTVPQELMTTTNMLAANQQLLFQHIAPLTQHMAAVLLQARQPMQAHQPAYCALPIQHLAIPGPAPFAGNGGGYTQWYNQGGISQSNGRHRNHHGNNCCGQGHTPFADHIAAQGRGLNSSQGAYQQAGGIHLAPPNPMKLYNKQ